MKFYGNLFCEIGALVLDPLKSPLNTVDNDCLISSSMKVS